MKRGGRAREGSGCHRRGGGESEQSVVGEIAVPLKVDLPLPQLREGHGKAVEPGLTSALAEVGFGGQ